MTTAQFWFMWLLALGILAPVLVYFCVCWWEWRRNWWEENYPLRVLRFDCGESCDGQRCNATARNVQEALNALSSVGNPEPPGPADPDWFGEAMDRFGRSVPPPPPRPPDPCHYEF